MQKSLFEIRKSPTFKQQICFFIRPGPTNFASIFWWFFYWGHFGRKFPTLLLRCLYLQYIHNKKNQNEKNP